jgi:phenylcoumaran benzylic ether reductase
VTEEDIGTYTIKAVDDPRTLNKILYIRPPGNILSHNELVSLWEKKAGKTFQREYILEDEVLKMIEGKMQKHVQNRCCSPHFSLCTFTRFSFAVFWLYSLCYIPEAPMPLNVVLSISHSVLVKGDHTNFDIDPSFGVETTELYPEVKYITVDEHINKFLWAELLNLVRYK